MINEKSYSICASGYKTWTLKEHVNNEFKAIIAENIPVYPSFEKILDQIDPNQFGLINYQDSKIALYTKDSMSNLLLISNDVRIENDCKTII